METGNTRMWTSVRPLAKAVWMHLGPLEGMPRSVQHEASIGGARAVFFPGLAFLCVVLALWAAHGMDHGDGPRGEILRAPEPTVTAMVAARDPYPGVTVTDTDVFAVAIPVRLLPGGFHESPARVVGRIPHERILANEFWAQRSIPSTSAPDRYTSTA